MPAPIHSLIRRFLFLTWKLSKGLNLWLFGRWWSSLSLYLDRSFSQACNRFFQKSPVSLGRPRRSLGWHEVQKISRLRPRFGTCCCCCFLFFFYFVFSTEILVAFPKESQLQWSRATQPWSITTLVYAVFFVWPNHRLWGLLFYDRWIWDL